MRLLSLAILGLALPSSCASVEGSSESVGDSSAGLFESLASPFESVSTSLGSGGESTAHLRYVEDVKAYTVSFLASPMEPGVEPGEFARGLTRVAEAHGINDWEADSATFTAIADAAGEPGVDGAARARLQRELEAYTGGN
jgi:hypothetical protein